MRPIRILIVDDHAIVRAGIRALLQLYSDFQVVGEAAEGHEAIRRVRETKPDVVLLDIAMPGMDGITATREICTAYPGARVLILTQHEHKEYLMSALRAGAAGYILKRAPDDTLAQAIRTVHGGGKYLDPLLSHVLVDNLVGDTGNEGNALSALTEREREVLVLLAQGKTYQEIANTLFISVKTVDFHRANLMRKLGLTNRAELVRFALEHGLLE